MPQFPTEPPGERSGESAGRSPGQLTATADSRALRGLAAALEPCIGQVYFSPVAHAAYAALGFGPSAAAFNGVAMPDGPAYFTSRGSLLGQVAPSVVAAAFAVFNPEAVMPSVAFGWTLTDAPTIRAARRDDGVTQLRNLAGPVPDALVSRTADLLAAGLTAASR